MCVGPISLNKGSFSFSVGRESLMYCRSDTELAIKTVDLNFERLYTIKRTDIPQHLNGRAINKVYSILNYDYEYKIYIFSINN